MRDFLEIFTVRLQDPQHFLPTRFAGLATVLTFVEQFDSYFEVTLGSSMLSKVLARLKTLCVTAKEVSFAKFF
jgi:hypothetical protein